MTIFKHKFMYFCYSSDSEKRENRNETAKEKSEKKHQSKLGKNGILKFDTIRCDALDPKVLLYNRIFKTGSSTTESLIMSSSSRMNYAYKIGKESKMWSLQKEKSILFVALTRREFVNGGCGLNEPVRNSRNYNKF